MPTTRSPRSRTSKTSTQPDSTAKLAFRPVTAETRRDFEALFESPGAPRYCWCMVWRRTPEEAKQPDNSDRKRQMMERIDRGVPVGLLGYQDGVPVAWVSIAPRSTYRASSLGSPEPRPGDVVWCLVCFFVLRRIRGQGTIYRLIEAAVAHARENGATVVESYPVEEASPSYRFMGFVATFRKAGFKEIGRAGSRRHVMQLKFG